MAIKKSKSEIDFKKNGQLIGLFEDFINSLDKLNPGEKKRFINLLTNTMILKREDTGLYYLLPLGCAAQARERLIFWLVELEEKFSQVYKDCSGLRIMSAENYELVRDSCVPVIIRY